MLHPDEIALDYGADMFLSALSALTTTFVQSRRGPTLPDLAGCVLQGFGSVVQLQALQAPNSPEP